MQIRDSKEYEDKLIGIIKRIMSQGEKVDIEDNELEILMTLIENKYVEGWSISRALGGDLSGRKLGYQIVTHKGYLFLSEVKENRRIKKDTISIVISIISPVVAIGMFVLQLFSIRLLIA